MISRPEGWVCSGSPCVSGFDPYGLDEFTSQLLHGLSLFIWFYFFFGGELFLSSIAGASREQWELLFWRGLGRTIVCADVVEPGILLRETASKTLGQCVRPTEHQRSEGTVCGDPGGVSVVPRAVRAG